MAGSSGRKRGERPDHLSEYRRKRSADGTPEPFATQTPTPRLFVVQKHAASRMHYDLRLEMRGALHSWAVPKGPSLDPEEKRLAVEVEDHPIEYGDFEGVIPDGNYGAGAVIVWDRGRWDPIGDPEEGLEKGKLLFDLHGYKLRGRWTLFRIKGTGSEWLLMKKPDGEADLEAPFPEESIRSGLTVEEVLDGVDIEKRLRARIRRLRPPRKDVDVMQLDLMLARTRDEPFSDPAWVFEIKYDGFRLLGGRNDAGTRLRLRGGSDATATFPEIAGALGALPVESFVTDGEVVVLDEKGRPSFQRLQQRVQLRRPADIRRATVDLPATYVAFDLLSFGGHDLRSLPLVQRKKLLRALLPPVGPLRFCEHIEKRGSDMFEAVRQMRLEGIMAKRAKSTYQGGRSADWLKIRADRTGDFVVVGYSSARGARQGFGALHLAVHEPEGLVYAGRVGTGFDSRQLDELHRELLAIRREAPAFGGTPPRGEEHTWVAPHLVAEVRFKEWTDEGHLRHPVFLRTRDDRQPEDCVREEEHETIEEPAEIEPPAEVREVSFTNRDKIFWPEESYTKGDLIDYYRAIAPWILPFLEDRPLVLTRYPDGIEGKSFFQKDAPGYVPDWLRTETMWSEHAKREIHYFVCDNEESLLFLANMASIPLHLWSSRMSALQCPDWCILDLDPKEAPFSHVIRVARAVRALCEEIGLPCYVKTSGSTGLHVLIPLGGQCTYEQSRNLGHVLARVIVSRHPDLATVTRSPSARGGRVYVDYVQNGHGRLLVSPYCVRPLPGAPVSTPLRWSEVRSGLNIRKHTIRTVPRRVRRMKIDPLSLVLEERPDLPAALERLAARM